MSKKDSQELKEQLSETLSSKEKKLPELESQPQEAPSPTGSSGSSPSQRPDQELEKIYKVCDELHSVLGEVGWKATELRQNIKALQEKVWDLYMKVSAEARRGES